MNKNELMNTTILYVIAITMLSAIAFVFVASTELTQNAVGQAEEVFNENASFIQEIEGGSPTATANQTGAAVQTGMNQTGAAVQTGMNQTGAAVQTGMNQTGEALTNASKSNVAQNISQGAQEIGQTTAKESGDIFGSISEAFKGLFGMK
jgi:predicted PurR-regulated permease PerM